MTTAVHDRVVNTRTKWKERGLAYLLLLPSLLIFGVFIFYPLIKSMYLGLYRSPPFPGLPSTYVGLDQVNIALPKSLRGSGNATVVLSVDGQTANAVTVSFK